MKRMNRARKNVALSIVTLGTVLATGTTAFAAEPVASVDVSDGSSEPTATNVDNAGVVDALVGLATTTVGVLNGEATPQVDENESGGVNIVLDPGSVPGLKEAFAPQGNHSGLTTKRGKDSAGNTVVFPTSGTLTSGFGQRWGTMHNGIDVANSVGTPIVAVMDGTVINSGPAQGFGNWIRIQHDDGTISVYGHMSADQLKVNVGDHVTAGQEIAGIGNEGHSTGPHLHFEIHPGGGAPVDPVSWFNERGISV